MHYVYILKSMNHSDKNYIGYTTNLKRRFAEHNDSQSFHTSKYAPWKLEMYFVFSTETKALKFEKYLKSGSGRAFAQMHFL